MANAYFNYTDPVQPGDRIESNKYNGDFGAIARAFDTLPSPDDLATNTRNYATSTGTGTAYAVNIPGFDVSFGYQEGMQVLMRAHVTNTGSATLSINGAAPAVLRNILTGTAPNYTLVPGDIAVNAIYSIRYDGTHFQVVNTVANAVLSAQQAANQASLAANSAQSLAVSAGNSAISAGNSATSASNSASSAQASASAAASSATSASTSEATASAAATSAADSATTASTSATTATTQATNAAGSASAAAASASAAAGSASAAAGSASAAAGSASAAAASAAAAQAVLTSTAFSNAVRTVLLSSSGSLRVGVVKLFAQNIDPNTEYPGSTWVRLPADTAIRTSLADGSDVMTTSGSDSVSLIAANIPSHTHTGSVTVGSFNYGTITSSTFNYGTVTSSSFNFGTVTTSSHNYGTITSASSGSGTVTTSSNGEHTHNLDVTNAGTTPNAFVLGQASTSPGTGVSSYSAGLHNHTATFGSHTHTLTIPFHDHTINLGSHTHSINLGSHFHTATLGTHTHTVSVAVANAGSGVAFSVRNRSIKLVAWRRTA